MPLFAKIIIVAAVVGALSWFFASIGGVLTPFVLAAVFAYIASPLAARLERQGMPAAAVAALVSVILVLLLIAAPLVLFPLMAAQSRELLALAPALAEKMRAWLGEDIALAIKERAMSAGDVGLDVAADAAGFLVGAVDDGVSALIGALSVALISPLATFYFLRDRRRIGGELTDMLPLKMRDRTLRFFHDLHCVLGEFLHAQMLAMLVMATFYALTLKLAGLNFAIAIGVLTGLLSFIPYVGFILGLSLATLVALGDFQSWGDIAVVWVLMLIGTTLETVVITPRLVGERVGLHPLAVLLSLLVMGELFGFVGLLASLPLAAVALVCCRHLRRYYIGSDFYR